MGLAKTLTPVAAIALWIRCQDRILGCGVRIPSLHDCIFNLDLTQVTCLLGSAHCTLYSQGPSRDKRLDSVWVGRWWGGAE